MYWVWDAEPQDIIDEDSHVVQCRSVKLSNCRPIKSLVRQLNYDRDLMICNPDLIECFDIETQIQYITEQPYLIKYIKYPNSKLQRIAVTSDPQLIVLIDNPTEEVQLIALRRDFHLVGLNSKETSENVKLKSLAMYSDTYLYLRNPTPEFLYRNAFVRPEFWEHRPPGMDMLFARQYPSIVPRFNNPDPAALITAVIKDPTIIEDAGKYMVYDDESDEGMITYARRLAYMLHPWDACPYSPYNCREFTRTRCCRHQLLEII